MPTYVYEVLLDEESQEGPVFEIEQGVDEPALTVHPVTGHKVRRIVQVANVATRYTSVQETRLKDPDYLKKHGFKRLEKDQLTGEYFETN